MNTIREIDYTLDLMSDPFGARAYGYQREAVVCYRYVVSSIGKGPEQIRLRLRRIWRGESAPKGWKECSAISERSVETTDGGKAVYRTVYQNLWESILLITTYRNPRFIYKIDAL